MADGEPRYVRPGWFTKHIFNRIVAALTRAGISVWGSRELRVRGRASGEWRTTPVNLLTVDRTRYLVAPRGETQWVRNLRAAKQGELRVGRRTEAFTAIEIADDEKPSILRRLSQALEGRGWRVLRWRECEVFRRGAATNRAEPSDLLHRGVAAER